jgi:anhydro-N-acetylmuramic acid kinase
MTSPFHIIGLMSGTSMDGLDIAYVRFDEKEKIHFTLLISETISYPSDWKHRLQEAFHKSPKDLVELDTDYGSFLGKTVYEFIQRHGIRPDLIASHGHTIFHKPQEGYTLQIGSGRHIQNETQIPVVCNFRVQDVALGGQGAPLVPIGDELLFPEYDFCLNLGGFSNVSWNFDSLRKACDISPCNILLNEICKRILIDYDINGQRAAKGKIKTDLLNRWNALPFYALMAPKSLGREWFEMHFIEEVHSSNIGVDDLLATSVQHIALQIDLFLKSVIHAHPSFKPQYKVLATGGGAHNRFLMEQLHNMGSPTLEYVIPETQIADYKEAIVFALLAYLRWHDRSNVLSSVTGASRDHSSGEVYL